VRKRLVDLLPVAKGHYYHPSQQGSWSIKKVLPALVPELEAAGMREIHPRAVGAALGEAATTVVVMTRAGR